MAHRRLLALVVVLACAAPAAAGAGGPGKLPPETLRGPENHLDEYPTVSLASPAELAGAQHLLAEIRAAAKGWHDLPSANAAGFDTRKARSSKADLTVHYLHAENRRNSNDRDYLDPRRPEALIYANVPGWPLRLVGVMFSMPRGKQGSTPGGPITRWHTHRVCARGSERGLAPLHDGSCPAGTTARQGSEMLHVWFTRDLRSAFAIHAPPRELGLAHLLPAAFCGLAH
jgi:hypothetical protein